MAQFGDAYKEFIGSVGEVVSKAIIKRTMPSAVEKKLQDLRRDVVDDLRVDDAVLAVEYAASRLHPRTFKYLLQELKFMNVMYPAASVQGTQKELDDSETCKESIEELLGDWLPDWLKDLLKILDEILKIASGGREAQPFIPAVCLRQSLNSNVRRFRCGYIKEGKMKHKNGQTPFMRGCFRL